MMCTGFAQGRRTMKAGGTMLALLLLPGLMVCGCGGGSNGGGTNPPPEQKTATPTITTKPAQNNALIVSLSDSTSGATIYYTLDGTTPTSNSPIYEAPFLVASNITVNAMPWRPRHIRIALSPRRLSVRALPPARLSGATNSAIQEPRISSRARPTGPTT